MYNMRCRPLMRLYIIKAEGLHWYFSRAYNAVHQFKWNAASTQRALSFTFRLKHIAKFKLAKWDGAAGSTVLPIHSAHRENWTIKNWSWPNSLAVYTETEFIVKGKLCQLHLHWIMQEVGRGSLCDICSATKCWQNYSLEYCVIGT